MGSASLCDTAVICERRIPPKESESPNVFDHTSSEWDFHHVTNIFGENLVIDRRDIEYMAAVDEYITDTEAPADRPHELLDARELPPPQPLQNTLELLVELDDETVLVQLNDRAPQHLYPKLTERGYQYETLETETDTVTVIWRS